MRKFSLLAAASLIAIPVVSEAKTLDELLVEKGVVAGSSGEAVEGKVSYDGGTRLSFGTDFDMKVNLRIQTLYSYNDYDKSEATDRDDTGGFNVKRVRAEFAGNLLNKEFSYKITNDFASDGGGSEMKDAYLQWNWNEAAQWRMGQYKQPFSRQENVSSAKLQFVDRSKVSDEFSPSRQRGTMIHGGVGGAGHYYAGVFNGFSDGEGINAGPTDNNYSGVAQFTYDIGDYGSRDMEGDVNGTKGFAMTFGGAFMYGQGEQEDLGGDADHYDFNVDMGMRVSGFSLQSEFYHATLDVDGADDKLNDMGAYIQAGYFFVPNKWEVATRFGWFSPDEDGSDIDDEQEYNVALGYYIKGHSLKLVNQATVDVTSFQDGDDLTDFRYDLLLAGYF